LSATRGGHVPNGHYKDLVAPWTSSFIWRLTSSEREVAVLLLKGHGHKQIAAATSRSERTVRQHSVAVYQKSGLQGRAELAAFFLEDLVVPDSLAANVEPPTDQSP
jgi:DNA-binding NarL/FixJ family response regulator